MGISRGAVGGEIEVRHDNPNVRKTRRRCKGIFAALIRWRREVNFPLLVLKN
jgi:hypothetical protein